MKWYSKFYSFFWFFWFWSLEVIFVFSIFWLRILGVKNRIILEWCYILNNMVVYSRRSDFDFNWKINLFDDDFDDEFEKVNGDEICS